MNLPTIGRTRTGQTLHEPGIDDNIVDFVTTLKRSLTLDELYDAYAVFDYLARRELRRSSVDKRRYNMYSELVDGIFKDLRQEVENCRLRAGLKGLTDCHEHGKACVNPEFKD